LLPFKSSFIPLKEEPDQRLPKFQFPYIFLILTKDWENK
jgi:hypothetical protein